MFFWANMACNRDLNVILYYWLCCLTNNNLCILIELKIIDSYGWLLSERHLYFLLCSWNSKWLFQYSFLNWMFSCLKVKIKRCALHTAHKNSPYVRGSANSLWSIFEYLECFAFAKLILISIFTVLAGLFHIDKQNFALLAISCYSYLVDLLQETPLLTLITLSNVKCSFQYSILIQNPVRLLPIFFQN